MNSKKPLYIVSKLVVLDVSEVLAATLAKSVFSKVEG